ncbi:MAG: hypothetical protein JOY64_12285 [Alphaproteobacteria bacterium]|nr:hypothetical protein [Alphaproteobacteria bacterium]MBV8408405.1 hypothetical protein [Alphaproteobacteria bacterium]
MVLIASMAATACAPPGYHYDGLTITPNDPCWLPEFRAPPAISWVNTTVGGPNGVPYRVESISNLNQASHNSLATVGLHFIPSGPNSSLCHVDLTFVNGKSDSGVLSIYYPGEYADLQIEWVSDTKIAAALAKLDGLRSGHKLLVKPDLKTPSVQQCVGRAVALDLAGEQFPGQLWAKCADPNNPITRSKIGNGP